MSRKARLWIGVTLLLVIAINYALFGYPLAKRRQTIKNKADAILIRQVKTGEMFKDSEEEYVLELFRNEARQIDRRMRNLNGAALTFIVIIVSWTAFGLISRHKPRNGKRPL